MSFRTLAATLAEALIEDLYPFTPYSMAMMTDYGKVGGYAPDYLEVKRDAEAFLSLCAALDLRGAGEAQDLPPLVLDRLIREEFFNAEQAALSSALKKAASAIRAEGEAQLEHRARALEPRLRRLFDHLLHRGGIDPEEALRMQPSPLDGGEKIYVASRHSVRLRDQICGYLADAGLDPIIAIDSESGGLDHAQAERDMAECAGGVFGLTPPGGAPGGAIPLDHRLAGVIDEIMLAETKMGSRLMILAQERLASKLPDRLRGKPIFTMRDREMDDVEFSLFKTVAARTPWLTR